MCDGSGHCHVCNVRLCTADAPHLTRKPHCHELYPLTSAGIWQCTVRSAAGVADTAHGVTSPGQVHGWGWT